MNNSLPFPRGDTASGGAKTPAAGYHPDLAGRVFSAPDTVHGTGATVKLRAVRNGASSLTVARKGIAYDTTALYHGVQTSGIAASAGVPSSPLDDAYVVGKVIAAYDIFWVVEEGPVSVIGKNSGTITADAAQAVQSDGTYANATAGQAVAGMADAALSGDGSTTFVLHARPLSQQVSDPATA
jgi:hypothetical protein